MKRLINNLIDKTLKRYKMFINGPISMKFGNYDLGMMLHGMGMYIVMQLSNLFDFIISSTSFAGIIVYPYRPAPGP